MKIVIFYTIAAILLLGFSFLGVSCEKHVVEHVVGHKISWWDAVFISSR